MKVKASYHQERLWFIDRFESGNLYAASPIYHNIPLILEINGELDINILEKCLSELIQRHEILCTQIITVDDKPVQFIHEQVNIPLEVVDLRSGNVERDEALAQAIKETRRPFLLETDLLIRQKLIRCEKTRYILVITLHHLVADRHSLEILVREMVLYYRAYKADALPRLAELPLQYADFSQWQHEFSEQVMEGLLFYWKGKLQEQPQPQELPLDRPRNIVHIYREGAQPFNIPPALYDQIENFTRTRETDTFILLFTAFKVLLHRYTGQEEIIVGIWGANRTQPGTQGIVGPIANLLPIRSQIKGIHTFNQVLVALGKDVKDAHEYQALPFDKLVLELKPQIDMSRTALFDILFQYEENPSRDTLTAGIEIKIIETNLGWGKYDMNMLMQKHENTISGIIVYNAEYYDETTIQQLTRHYQELLGSLLEAPDRGISAISILTAEEKHRMIEEWNQTRANYPREKTLHQLYEEIVEKTPHAAAVIRGHSVLTYKETNARANRTALYIKGKYSIQPDTLVAIMVEPSMEMIIGILAILKAGGAYVPIAPWYPPNRVHTLLADTRARLLLTDTGSLGKHVYTDLQGLESLELKPYKTAPRPRITDLDHLPYPDRSLVNYEKYSKTIGQAVVKNCFSLQATRGCPYNCAYCHKIWSKQHVYRTAENILAEIRRYYDMGIRRYAFIDDIFNLDLENSRKFFQLVIQHNLEIQLFFPNGLRGDLLTREYIDLMVKAGTTGMALALETPVPRLQKLIGKNLHIGKLRENLEYICQKYPALILELFTMHGFPTETPEEALMTLEFIKSLKWIHFPYVNILRIYPGTDMEKLALENNISREAINRQVYLTQNDTAETLPFDKNFTQKYQADFLNEYFLLKERLLQVLPNQMQVLTEDEILQKYNSYLAIKINKFSDLLELAGIKREELKGVEFAPENRTFVPGLNKKLTAAAPRKNPPKHAPGVLLLDLSQFFTNESQVIYDVVEPPLGLMALMTYMHRQLGNNIRGKIAKSRIDFDNCGELKKLIDEFKPAVIGIRTLSVYKEFFHRTIALIRQWGIRAPIIAGGPYATSSSDTILQDPNVDLVVPGEGEITFTELVEAIMKNRGKLPEEHELKKIPGIVFIPTQEKNKKNNTREILWLDQPHHQAPGETPSHLASINQPGDLAYVIYTSGSTGTPKGAAIPHRNVVCLLKNDRLPFTFESGDRWIMAHSFCFDFSVWEMYGALLNGAGLLVPDRDQVRDTPRLLSLLQQRQVTILNQTPQAFYQLAQIVKNTGTTGLDRHLRLVIFGGDKLEPAYLQEWVEMYPLKRIQLVNMYGITETTVHNTWYYLQESDICHPYPKSTIGKPLPGIILLILDKYLQLQPPGIPGEMYAAGSGVAKGYINRPGLTAEKFCPRRPGGTLFEKTVPPGPPRKNFSLDMPRSSNYRSYPSYKSHILYKTGDLAKRQSDGNILFLGRIDHQVKIRGFRIEPGEIENQLLTHEQLRESVVVLKEDKNGDRYLCAYVVYTDTGEHKPGELRDHLSHSLPNYMIPAYFVPLNHIPLTANGKLDRKALPEPKMKSTAADTPPRDEIEKKLAKIWAEVLNLNISAKAGETSIDDDFFELGGHSLKAAQLTASIHKTFDVSIQLADIFSTPTIRGLAAFIKNRARHKYTGIQAAEKREYYPLSSAQKGVFIHQQLKQDTTYNSAQYWNLEGELDKEKFQETTREIIRRHDSFRTSFHIIAGQPIQRIHDDVEFAVEYADLQEPGASDRCRWEEEQSPDLEGTKGLAPLPDPGSQELRVKNFISSFIRPFDLSQPPLLRVALIRTRNTKHILVLDMHHIITDGVSQEIFVKDFIFLYEKLDLPLLPLQYKDYAQWLNSQPAIAIKQKHEKYWLREFEGDIPVLRMPGDFKRPDRETFAGEMLTIHLPQELNQKLNQLAKEKNTTIYMLLLAAFYVLLSKYSGQEDIVVGTPVAGRRHPELQNIIGMFVNMLAIRNRPAPAKTFTAFLKEVKDTVLRAVENQETHYEELVTALGIQKNPGRNPLFDVVFAMQNVDIEGNPRKILPHGEISRLEMTPYEYQHEVTQFDLILGAFQGDNTITLNLRYSTTLYRSSTAEKILHRCVEILEQIVENVRIKLEQIIITHELLTASTEIIDEDEFEI